MELEAGDLWAERPEEREVDDFAARLDDATANLEEIALGAIDGSDPSQVATLPTADPVRHASSAPTLPGSATEQAKHAGRPAGAQALAGAKGIASSGQTAAGATGDELQLDLERAGLAASQGTGQLLPGQKAGAVVAQTPDQEVVGAVAAGLPVPVASAQAMARRSPGVSGERVTLFGPDPVFAFLVAAAIGLLVGVFPASRSAAALYERETADLYTELEHAVDKPLAVRAGDLREPQVIAAEIQDRRAPARSRFFLIWLAVAVPITLALGLIRRPAS